MIENDTSPASPTDLPLFAQRPTPQARGLGGGARPAHPAAPPIEASAETAPRWATTEVPWSDITTLRGEVTQAFQRDNQNTAQLEQDVHGERIGQLIDSAINDYSQRRLATGQGALDTEARASVRRAMLDAIFGAGRLQPLLALEGVENIEMNGSDSVFVEYADGDVEEFPPVFDSDEDMVNEIKMLAQNSPSGEREFSPLHNSLRMSLPDGSRLSADAWYTPRPHISIRKHRFIDTSLDEMRELGMIDHGLQSFLTAAVLAGMNIVVSGVPKAGKTTLVRALFSVLDPMERFAQLETHAELHMDKLHHRHKRVFPAETLAGGEIRADGRREGQVDLTDIIERALQQNISRFVVGEAVGVEVTAMMEAMQSGHGGVSTIHATNGKDTVERLATLITRARGNVPVTFANRTIAQNIQVIVHISLIDESHLKGGRRHRFVDEVIALEVSNEPSGPGYATVPLWSPGHDGRAQPVGGNPPFLDTLIRFGFDPTLLDEGTSTWGPSPKLIYPYRRGGAA